MFLVWSASATTVLLYAIFLQRCSLWGLQHQQSSVVCLDHGLCTVVMILMHLVPVIQRLKCKSCTGSISFQCISTTWISKPIDRYLYFSIQSCHVVYISFIRWNLVKSKKAVKLCYTMSVWWNSPVSHARLFQALKKLQ